MIPTAPSPRPEGAGDVHRRPRRAAVTVESLEGRELLSHVSPFHARLTHAVAPIVIPPPLNSPGPIVGQVGLGFAVKSPRFYPGYVGPRRAELNAAGAKGLLTNQGDLVLTGIIAANGVLTTPASAAEEAFYSFGIDRGGAPFPGPIPGRPGIKFDTVVTVSVLQTGITASVTDLDTGVVTPISTDNLVFKQNALQVTVPASVVATFTGSGPAPVRATFWASNSSLPGDFQSIASFAPEFRGFVIAVGRIPHRGR